MWKEKGDNEILASQMSLLESTALTAPKRSSKSRFSDPSFTRNRNNPIHGWVPWIAGFSREFTHDVISSRLIEKGTILDPFAGVGTTLIEGTLLGHEAIGFEINPYAVMAADVKLQAHKIAVNKVLFWVDQLIDFYTKRISTDYV